MTETSVRSDLEQFRSLVAERLGLFFDDDRLDFLEKILRQRAEKMTRGAVPAYLQRMYSSGEEIRALAEQLTVGETYFFRYQEHFSAFADVVIPSRVRARDSIRRLRFLSAGCASGEEAYSLAILLRERFPELASWDVAIHGADVNPAVLDRAHRARYPLWSLRETPPDLQAKYFCGEGRELKVQNAVKAMVRFEERNLVKEDPLFWQSGAFDAVFCRNMIMYLTPAAARELVARIAHTLAPGGFLFLGHAETLRGISDEFHLRHTHDTFYYVRRGDRSVRRDPGLNAVSAGVESVGPRLTHPAEASASWFENIRRASERIAHLTSTKSGDTGNRVSRSANQPPVPPPRAGWDGTVVLELLRQERFGEAITLLRELSPGSHADPDAQLLLAVVLTNHGDIAEAEQICRRLLNLDERNPGVHYLLALCREHAGDREGAAEHDRAAIRVDSSFVMAHLHLGLLARRAASAEMARSELSLALMLLPREDASKILLFGGGFTREALSEFCRTELARLERAS